MADKTGYTSVSSTRSQQSQRKLLSLSIAQTVKWARANLCEDSRCKTEVRVILSELRKAYPSLSDRACGLAIRRAFPVVTRRKVGAVYFYFGLKLVSSHTNGNPANDKGYTNNKEVVGFTSPKCQHNKNAISKRNIDMQKKPDTCREYEHHRTHEIKCLNINLPELRTDDTSVLGEGTFGKCVLGTYKGIPVAVKIFKERPSWKTIHSEANIMLKIPSHPGIPMLIGLFTLHYPYLLVTKFHDYSGKSMTYSKFLKHCQKVQDSSCLFHLLCTLLDAIIHLHQTGILHNDIKGNNVLVEKMNKQKHCLLIDFGKTCFFQEAKASSRLKHMTEVEREEYRRTYPHVAPEVSESMVQSAKSDAYSFGYLYCTTMKVKGEVNRILLRIGQELTHWKPEKRPDLCDVKMRIMSK